MIRQNPFTSATFTKIWGNHFNNEKTAYRFQFLKNLDFFKPSSLLPLYINYGKNLTKGISYNLSEDESFHDFSKKVFLIYDVPQYFNINANKLQKKQKLKKISQYSGFLINMENHKDFDAYFSKTFSKSSKQKFNRYNRRLEMCFDIKEKMLIGNIEKSEYDFVFGHFKELLAKRFDDKQITNNNLNPEEWSFYYDVVYPLILEKKAALHVIYNNETPISVRLLYFSESVIFDAITVFDIDYTKFHIGKISIMKMLQWSFESDYKIFDFSKGYFDYKESWSDLKYDFEYQIFYDSKSITAYVLANLLAFLFKTKQYLRDKNINEKLHKITFALKKKATGNIKSIKELDAETYAINGHTLQEVQLNGDFNYLRKSAYDFLFLSNEHLNDLKTYQIKDGDRSLVLLKGKSNTQVLEIIEN